MFELNQQCVIEHVNVRRGKNDESEVAVDIKFSVEDVPAKAVAGVLCASSPQAVEAAFFDGDEKRFLGIGNLAIEEEFEGKHMIRISGLSRLRVLKLARIRLTPRAKGMFDGMFRVTIEQPPQNFIESIADKIHRSVSVHLEQDVRELPLKTASEVAGAEGRKPGVVRKIQGAVTLQ